MSFFASVLSLGREGGVMDREKTLVAMALLVGIVCLGGGCSAGSWYQDYGLSSEAALNEPASAPAIVAAFGDDDPKVRLAAIETKTECRC